jgi:uncharacterized protein (DUF1778 family)
MKIKQVFKLFQLRNFRIEDHRAVKMAAAATDKGMNEFIIAAALEKAASINSRKAGAHNGSTSSK